MTYRDEEKLKKSVGYRFKEFEALHRNAELPAPEAADRTPQHHDPSFFRILESLSNVFEREAGALRDGDFEKFNRLQNEKLSVIRSVEKGIESAIPSLKDMDRKNLERRLSSFNAVIDNNMKTIDAMRKAVSSVKSYAMKAIEDRQSDGVYARNGAVRGPARLSANAGNQIKL
ncbi:hypothetical protein [Hyphococcus sp.]|uniref:hypothetical protein n=1 Tax=Hyphococcus sp. TaxID=2038636 RepID=UPI003D0C264A